MPSKAAAIARSAAVGAVSALAVALVVTVAQLVAGSSVGAALWLTRRLVLALGALVLVIGAAGMAFPSLLTGAEDEAVSRVGLSWYALVMSCAAGALLTGTVLDLVVVGLG